MKSIYRVFAIILPVLVLSLFTGCKKDGFLSVEDLSAISSNVTWSSTSTADLVLNDIYEVLPDLNNNVFDPLDNWSDNSMCGFSWAPTATVLRDMTTLTPSSDVSVTWNGNGPQWLYWGVLYDNIRKCNVFISGLSASNLPKDYKDQRLGEAYTLRAFFYHYLWMFFGGVPLISKPDNRVTDGDSVFHPRASFDETYQFIIADLDTAASLLPANNGNDGAGRITKGAALTLKAWCQLFYASPLYNTGDDKSRWAAAAATCKLVEGMGYSLYPKYDELFFSTGNNNNEGILYREYLKNTKTSNIIGYEGPNTVGSLWLSWGGMNPTQDLVDDYAMANGKAITDAGSGYDAQNPYENREPRFYQSILYSGSTFDGYLYTTYTGKLNGVSANNPIDLSDANDFTNTGYAMRKRMDTTTDFFGGVNSWQNYYFFRYADVLLMHAEAENEAVGPDATVYGALDQIRTRAGVPTVSSVYPNVSQAEMREIIRRERRVELAFEGKRYWDLIRWKTAEVNINRSLKAMHITASGSTLTYDVIDAARGNRKFDASKNYVLPIPQSAISRNTNLTQNPNY